MLADLAGPGVMGILGGLENENSYTIEMLCDDLIEDGATRVSRLVSGRYHIQTSRRQQLPRSPMQPILHICALYQIIIPLSNQKGVLIQTPLSVDGTEAVRCPDGCAEGRTEPVWEIGKRAYGQANTSPPSPVEPSFHVASRSSHFSRPPSRSRHTIHPSVLFWVRLAGNRPELPTSTLDFRF